MYSSKSISSREYNERLLKTQKTCCSSGERKCLLWANGQMPVWHVLSGKAHWATRSLVSEIYTPADLGLASDRSFNSSLMCNRYEINGDLALRSREAYNVTISSGGLAGLEMLRMICPKRPQANVAIEIEKAFGK